MENEPVLSESTKRRRAKKEQSRFPDAVAAMYEILKDFGEGDRSRVIHSVEVLLEEPEVPDAK